MKEERSMERITKEERRANEYPRREGATGDEKRQKEKEQIGTEKENGKKRPSEKRQEEGASRRWVGAANRKEASDAGERGLGWRRSVVGC